MTNSITELFRSSSTKSTSGQCYDKRKFSCSQENDNEENVVASTAAPFTPYNYNYPSSSSSPVLSRRDDDVTVSSRDDENDRTSIRIVLEEEEEEDDDEDDIENYHYNYGSNNYLYSTPKRQKMYDGIFRPISGSSSSSDNKSSFSSSSSSFLTSPPPLLRKCKSFYHDITSTSTSIRTELLDELSNEDLSFLSLPTLSFSQSECESSSPCSVATTTALSQQRPAGLLPRRSSEALFLLNNSSSTDHDDVQFRINKGTQLFDINEDEESEKEFEEDIETTTAPFFPHHHRRPHEILFPSLRTTTSRIITSCFDTTSTAA